MIFTERQAINLRFSRWGVLVCAGVGCTACVLGSLEIEESLETDDEGGVGGLQIDGDGGTSSGGAASDGGEANLSGGAASDGGAPSTGGRVSCEAVPRDHLACSPGGDVVWADSCGELELDVVERCAVERGTCEEGVCDCEAGWRAPACSESLVFVNQGSGNDDSSGASWQASLQTLSAALVLAATKPTEIWVAGGTYFTPAGESFQLSEGTQLYGGFQGGEQSRGQRDISMNETVLSGDSDRNGISDDQNANHVLSVQGSGLVVLDGFTVTGGNASGNLQSTKGIGGGLLLNSKNKAGDLRIANCIFRDNQAVAGGALGLVDSAFSRAVVTDSVVENNTANDGGGIYASDAVLVLKRVSLTDNSAIRLGGGLRLMDTESSFASVVIADNTGDAGGGIALSGGGLHLATSLLFGNSAGETGGGITAEYGSVDISGTTFARNDANTSGGGGDFDGVSFSFVNGIAWANEAPQSSQFHFTAGGLISYSLLEGGCPATAMSCESIQQADPLFVEAGAGDYRLQSNSPCVNAGNNAFVSDDLVDLDGDNDVAEALPHDLDGRARILGTTVDCGSYERE